MAAKTTTKKTTKKTSDDRKHKKDGFRVQCKAGLLTYNEVSLEIHEDLVDMHKELKVKFPDCIFSLCLEKENRLHAHVFFESEERLDCDLGNFETTKSGKVGDFQPNRGKNVDRGHWYVQCKWKKSHITTYFDKLIKPAPKWVSNQCSLQYTKHWKVSPIILLSIRIFILCSTIF